MFIGCRLFSWCRATLKYGSIPLTPEQMNCFFKLMKERYEAKRPTIITTNLTFDDWYDILKPKDMADALLDRLRHPCCIININGNSLRTPSED